MKPLTERQKEVLEAIIFHVNEYGYPPTFRELGSYVKMSSNNGINDHLRYLSKKGYIRRESGASRGIAVLRWPDGSKAAVRVIFGGDSLKDYQFPRKEDQ